MDNLFYWKGVFWTWQVLLQCILAHRFEWLKQAPESWDFLLSTVLVEQTVPLTWTDSASPVTRQEIPTSYSKSVLVAQIPECPICLTV